MPLDDPTPRISGPGRQFRLQIGGPLGAIVGAVVGVVGLVVAVMFSLIVLAVVLGAGLAFGAWFWWKTRALREQVRAAPMPAPSPREREVEGEVISIERSDPQRRGEP